MTLPYRPSIAVVGFLVAACCAASVTSAEEVSRSVFEQDAERVQRMIEEFRYAEAEAEARRLLSYAETAFGDESFEVAAGLELLLDSLGYQGKGGDPETQALALRAVELVAELYGDESSEFSAVLGKAGLLFYQAGELVQAKTWLERAVAIDDGVYPPDHTDRVPLYRALGYLLVESAEYERARAVLQRALEIDEGHGRDVDIAWSSSYLAHLHVRMGELDKARPLLEKALEIYSANYVPNHPELATALNELGHAMVAEGETEDARELYERALEIETTLFGADSLDAAMTTANLGRLYFRDFRYADALPLLEQALEVFELRLGPDHPESLPLISPLATSLSMLGEHEAALTLATRALEISRASRGPANPSTGLALLIRAACLEWAGRFDEAVTDYERCRAIAEQSFGPDHLFVADPLVGLGASLAMAGRPERARPALERALEILADAPDWARQQLAEAYLFRAFVAAREGDDLEAEGTLELAVAIERELHGERSPDASLAEARYHALLGHQAEALRFLARAVELGCDRLEVLTAPEFRFLHGDVEFRGLAERIRSAHGVDRTP